MEFDERWLDIPDLTEYEVSNYGNFRRKDDLDRIIATREDYRMIYWDRSGKQYKSLYLDKTYNEVWGE